MTTRTLAKNVYKAAKTVYRTKRSKLPILDSILVTLHEGRIALASHDLSEPLAAFVPCKWDGDTWAACVPMKPFKDWLAIVAKSKEILELSFCADSQELTITTDARLTGTRSRTTFYTLPACEFPPVDLDMMAEADRAKRRAL